MDLSLKKGNYLPPNKVRPISQSINQNLFEKIQKQIELDHNYAKQISLKSKQCQAKTFAENSTFTDPSIAEAMRRNEVRKKIEINRAIRQLKEKEAKKWLNVANKAKRASSIKKLRRLAERSKSNLDKMENTDLLYDPNNRRVFKPKLIGQEIHGTIGLSLQKPKGLMSETRPAFTQEVFVDKKSNLKTIQRKLATKVRANLLAIKKVLSEDPKEELPQLERLIHTSFVLAKSIEEILHELQKQKEKREVQENLKEWTENKEKKLNQGT